MDTEFMLAQCFVPYGQHTLVLVVRSLDFSPIHNQNQVQFLPTPGFQQVSSGEKSKTVTQIQVKLNFYIDTEKESVTLYN